MKKEGSENERGVLLSTRTARGPAGAEGALELAAPGSEAPRRRAGNKGTGSDERQYLEFVLESINRVQNYAGGYYQSLAVNQMAQDAIVWRLRILADWAKGYVTDEEKQRHSEIPWPEICDFSGMTVHQVDHLNIHRIWLLAKDDLQPLKRVILGQLKKLR